MATPITPVTFLASSTLASAQLNAVQNNVSAAQNPATAGLYEAGAMTVAFSGTTLLWDTVVWNPAGMWTAGATDRLVVPTGWAGKYHISAIAAFPATLTGSPPYVELKLYKNGVQYLPPARTPVFTGAPNVVSLHVDAALSVTDVIQVYASYPGTGSALMNAGVNANSFSMSWFSL